MPEADLILQINTGNKIAFKHLVHAHEKMVMSVCARFFSKLEDVQDISQEVFIEVYKSLNTYRGDAKLSTWIYRIAMTKSLDEIKLRKRKKRISELVTLPGMESELNNIAGDDAPDKRVEAFEQNSLLVRALNKLANNQRKALTLSKIEGYSNKEIAGMMKTTTTAVDALIYRSKQTMKLYLNCAI